MSVFIAALTSENQLVFSIGQKAQHSGTLYEQLTKPGMKASQDSLINKDPSK